ncbi:hypothetical protein [Paenibacillus sp. FSL H3-0333]|uniref:hypothetical protein n=1 Tax=Paenibacillus sp. FSL H3-0333 TaxID=2921373 RepID=UPI004046B521
MAIFAAPKGNKVYVANAGERNVTIIDTLTDTVIINVDVVPGNPGKPYAFAGNANSDSIWRTNCYSAPPKEKEPI